MKLRNRLLHVPALVMGPALAWSSLPCFAELNLDLASKNRTVVVGADQLSTPTTIQAGGKAHVITPGAMLTPAEFVALTQVINTGKQDLKLDAAGRASGGSFILNSVPNVADLSGLTIPSRVTALHDFASTAGTLNLSGNLVNSGNFFALSTNAATNSANISAANIFNNPHALLSTVLPAGGLPSFLNAISNLNLNLNAASNIMNAGTITSAGSLTATAGGSITNALPTGIIGLAPVMQATQNLNLNTSHLVNSGVITSANANINIVNQSISNLLVNNLGGTMKALSGSINVGDLLTTTNASLSGGNWLSNSLNINVGSEANLNIGQVSGIINAAANDLHITASTDALRLGNICLKGDPTFYNLAGDVLLNDGFDLTTNGEDLAIVAKGDIKVDDLALNPVQIDTDGGDVLMVAGANFTVPSGDDITIFGTSPEGGEIDLSTGPGCDLFNTTPTASNSNGGNITLVAFGGESGTSSVLAGKITLPLLGLNVTSGGTGSGANGNFTAIAGELSADSTSIIIGGVDTSGGTGSGGQIGLYTSIPVLTVGGNPSSSIDIVNHSLLAGHAITTDTTKNLQNNHITAFSLTSTGRQGTSVIAGGNIFFTNASYVPNGNDGPLTNVDGPHIDLIGGASGIVHQLGATLAPNAQLNIQAGSQGFISDGDISAGDIKVESQGIITVKNVTSTAGAYTINAKGEPIEVKSASLRSIGASSGDITVLGTICCNRVFLQSTFGNVGSISNRVNIAANVAVDVGVNSGSAFLTGLGDLTLFPTSFVGKLSSNTLDVETKNNGDIVLGGLDSFGVFLTGAVPNINFLGGQNSLKLTADGTGEIRQSDFVQIHAGQATLTSGTGDIGFHNLDVNGKETGLWIFASSIEAKTGGNVFLTQATVPDGKPRASVLINNVPIADGKSFLYRTDYSATQVELSKVNAGNNSSITVNSAGKIVVLDKVSVGTGSSIDIGTQSDLVLSAPTGVVEGDVGSNITLNAGKSLLQGTSVLVSAGGSISVTTGQDIQPTSATVKLGAGSVFLDAPGDIGSPSSPINTFTEKLTVNSSTNAYINSEASFPMELGIVNSNNFNFTTEGDLTLTNSMSGAAASISSNSGSITVNSNMSFGAQISLIANKGSITNNANGPVIQIGKTGSHVFISTPQLKNNGIIVGETINVSSPTGIDLHISGTGKFTSNDTRLAAPGDLDDTNTITFDNLSNQHFFGPTTFIANGDLQPNILIDNAVVVVDSPLSLLAHGYTKNFGSLSADPIRLITPNGAGIISVGQGDVVLQSNLIFEGKNLTIISPGNIFATAAVTKIELKSKDGTAGNLTLIAGFDFTKSPAGSPFDQRLTLNSINTVTGPSSHGGSIVLPKVAIDTSTQGTGFISAIGGNVVAVAHKGSENIGAILLKSVTATGGAQGRGGNVTLIGQGGVKATGLIDTSGSTGGNVTVAGAEPIIVGGPIVFQNGYLRSAGVFVALPVDEKNGASVIIGSTKTSGSFKFGGDVNIRSDSQVSVGNITATGAGKALDGISGGSVTISSLANQVNAANIDVSGVPYATFPTAPVVSTHAGSIVITAYSGISVGNLIAHGGARPGKGSGGNGGQVFASTASDNIKGYFTGSILVDGYIDTRGGDGNLKVDDGSSGGAGGSVFLNGGTVQVLKALSNVSINVAGGTAKNSANGGSGGTVQINTYGVQPFPRNFDLISSIASEAVLPGGLFTVGAPKVGTALVNAGKPPINGTVGWINSGSITQALKVSSLTDTNPAGDEYNQLGVSINITGGSETYKVIVNESTTPALQFRSGTATVSGLRQFVTPAAAVALYQVSRGLDQQIGVLGSNGVGVGRNPQFSTTTPGFSPAIIQVDERDIRGRFTNFNLSVLNTTNSALAGDAELNVSGLLPVIDLSLTKQKSINGRVMFETPDAVSMIFGAKSLGSPLGSITTAPTGTLVIGTTEAKILNLGKIEAGKIAFLGTGSSLTIDNGLYSPSPATTYSPSISGVLHATDPRVIIPTTGTLPAYNFKTSRASFLTPISFETFQLPTSFGAVGTRTLPTADVRNVRISALNTSLGIGNTYVPGNVTIRGEVLGGDISINTITDIGPTKAATNLIFDTGAYVYSIGGTSIVSAGTLQLNDSTVNGGNKTKPLTITAAGDITTNNSSIFSNYKGSITSQHGSFTDLGTGSHGSYDDSLSITAESNITFNSASSLGTVKGLTIQSKNAGITLSGNLFNASGVLRVVAAKGISVGATLSSGELTPTAPSTGNLSKNDIAKMFDGVTAKAGSISIISGSKTMPHSIAVLANAKLTSNGGNVSLASFNDISLSTPATISANGGNVFLLAMGSVEDSNNVFSSNVVKVSARAIGTAASSTGGVIEIGSGLTAPTIASPPAQTSTVSQSALTRGPGSVTINGTGALKVNVSSQGKVELNNYSNSAVINMSGGAIVIDAKSTTPGKGVIFDGIQLDVSAFKPIAFVQEPEIRTALIVSERDAVIDTAYGAIQVKRGAVLTLETSNGIIRVQSCSGPHDVSIKVENGTIPVAPGQEVLLTGAEPREFERHPYDGIGRRGTVSYKMGKTHLTISDFSIISLLQNADYLSELKASKNNSERRILSKVLKTAAAVQTLTAGKRGAYNAKPKVPGSMKHQRRKDTLAQL